MSAARAVLVLVLAACKTAPPEESDAPDPVDPVLPAPVASTLGLSTLDAEDAASVCAELSELSPVELTCDAVELVFADAPLDACPETLLALPGPCEATVGDLRACADAVGSATCDSDFSEDPCRTLFAPGCAPLDALGEALLGAPFGLQDPLHVADLTQSQVYAFCLEQTDYAPVNLSCEDPKTGDTVELTALPAPQADCVAQLTQVPFACPATLGESRACSDALFLDGDCSILFGGGPCASLQTPECQP